ncbi:conserved exported protein of unknown function [Nitrospira japonica]|uniref:Lcl C-terminal domain-containing protein n=1 Tax=Nitrospira japonica TaxID=1325564 RepID=A0A1W1I519_9BACT|nr:DUF1566 domain-containing protein [Nitrospira japonica]SLM48096.1 conserved exported protein of unknown function [Nitrospira japonica]
MLKRFLGSMGIILACTMPSFAVPLESWDDKIPNGSQRFKVLSEFNDEAVLDKETQLVWERAPYSLSFIWKDARGSCPFKIIGGRRGWRLPSFVELMSLVDPTANASPLLPPGHPFSNIHAVPGDFYWSATTSADVTTDAWEVFFGQGTTGPGDKMQMHFVWCVRGPMNADQY